MGGKKKYIELFGSFAEPFILVNDKHCDLEAQRPSVSSGDVGFPASLWTAIVSRATPTHLSSPSAWLWRSLVMYAVPGGAEKSIGARQSHVTQPAPRPQMSGCRFDRDRVPLSPTWQFVTTAFDSWIWRPSNPPYSRLTSTPTESVGGSISCSIIHINILTCSFHATVSPSISSHHLKYKTIIK